MPQNNPFFPSENASGFGAPSKLDALTSALLMSQALGKYGSSSANGRLFNAANQAGVTLSAALATTYVGICLSNPAASKKTLYLLRATGLLEVAPAAFIGLGLIAGWSAAGVVTHTTALTPLSELLGSGDAPAGLADSACTIVGTPAWNRWFTVNVSATGEGQFSEDIDGAIAIPPGGYVAIGATVAGPALGFLGSFVWEEM